MFQFYDELFLFCDAFQILAMQTLLLIEDDKLLRHVLKETLEGENFLVLEAANGMRSMEIIAQHHVDLILLDLRLPDGSGLDLIPRIRGISNAPIVIVSGEKDKSLKMSGFSLGASDYVGKPFDMDELIARVKANLQRNNAPDHSMLFQREQNSNLAEVRFETWTLDRKKFQIFNQSGGSANLTFREFQLMDVLVACAGKVMSRHDLCKALHEKNYVLSPRAIDAKITRIRKKIGDDADSPRLIKTVRGAGYFFEKNEIIASQADKYAR